MTKIKEFEKTCEELVRTSAGRRTFLASVAMLFSACATRQMPFTEDSSVTDHLTAADEERMLREALLEIRMDYPALRDSEVQKFVSVVGQRLVGSDEVAKNRYSYTFTVVEAPVGNAFALPAGAIYVTVPLLRMVRTEAELAGVLGHEIGHVLARHAALRIHSQRTKTNRSLLYGGGGSIVGGVAGMGVGQAVCLSNSSCVAQLASLGAAIGVKGGLLVQKYRYLANSRENEFEADRIGFEIARKAGYSAKHLANFHERVSQFSTNPNSSKNSENFAELMNTHPPSEERLAQFKILVEKSPVDAKAVVSSKEFESMQRSLMSANF